MICTPGFLTRPLTENERMPLLPLRPCSENQDAPFSSMSRTQNKVSKLYYEVYQEMAEKILQEIENTAQVNWKINKLIAVHRIGILKIGEVSVAVAVSSEHRKEAFEACKFGIDSIKEKVPVWKKEFDESGAEWLEGVIKK